MVVKVVGSAAAVLVVVAVTADPKLVLKLTFRVFASHFAKRVKSAVLPWVYGNEMAGPAKPSLSNQPRKV